MPCKKSELSQEIVEKVKSFFETHTDKSYRAGEIAQELGIEKDLISKAIKKLKEEGIIAGRCAYKIAK